MKFKPLVTLFAVPALLIVLTFAITPSSSAKGAITVTNTSPPKGTVLPSPSRTPTPRATLTPLPSVTMPSPTLAPTSTPGQGGNIQPYPSAPLCGTHDNTFHALWDAVHGCHYDHEHGQNPFTSAVSLAFPGFDLSALLCGNEISHCNPSSPMENTMKHGGYKWQVDLAAPNGCAVGFESGSVAIDAYAIQFHDFGPQDVEFEAHLHSAVALLRQCKPTLPNDKGYVFLGQLQEYGERVMPYQGAVLQYPFNFVPEYDGSFGPYFTTECFGPNTVIGGKTIACRPTLTDANNNLTIWTSKRTGPVSQPRPVTSTRLAILFRGRDSYQRFDITDLVHPFTWKFVCGGMSFDPAGCRFNNSTSTIQELKGTIPPAWDGLIGFDTDTRVGRITADGFLTRFGDLALSCPAASGLDCQPIKLVGAFVGVYSSEVSVVKVSNPTPQDTPERDIYFCNGMVCNETTPGAVPSGWIGGAN